MVVISDELFALYLTEDHVNHVNHGVDTQAWSCSSPRFWTEHSLGSRAKVPLVLVFHLFHFPIKNLNNNKDYEDKNLKILVKSRRVAAENHDQFKVESVMQ